MKKILAIHTGGTISMSENDEGNVTTSKKNPINENINDLDNIRLVNEELFNLPSPQMTPKTMLEVKNRILQAITEGYDGVVVTHGTDTLEETAYFLDLTIPNDFPVVITGAMRSSNEIGADGIFNFKSAVQVAASDNAKNKGVLVVFNAGIYAARYVTKTHTTSVDTFKAPIFGALGTVDHGEVYFAQQLIGSTQNDVKNIVNNVYLIKAYAGMTDKLLSAIDNNETNGLVIEAMGAGNLPPEILPTLQHILERGIPVVLVSRCYSGQAQPIYSYDGGGVMLQEMGLIYSGQLNGQKARIKLIVGLSSGKKGNELKEFISNKNS